MLLCSCSLMPPIALACCACSLPLLCPLMGSEMVTAAALVALALVGWLISRGSPSLSVLLLPHNVPVARLLLCAPLLTGWCHMVPFRTLPYGVFPFSPFHGGSQCLPAMALARRFASRLRAPTLPSRWDLLQLPTTSPILHRPDRHPRYFVLGVLLPQSMRRAFLYLLFLHLSFLHLRGRTVAGRTRWTVGVVVALGHA